MDVHDLEIMSANSWNKITLGARILDIRKNEIVFKRY